MIFLLILLSSVLTEVSENLKSVKSLECEFDELLIFQGDTLIFDGMIYALKDRARIDVYNPEREVMIFHGDSVFILREKTGQIYRRQTPIAFYNILFSSDNSYKVDSTRSNWFYLSSLKNKIGYPISIRFNKDFLPEKMNFIQETGMGMFTFSSYKFNKTYPENFFSLKYVSGEENQSDE
jgi:outer membrane lipoprotein-sorting protein